MTNKKEAAHHDMWMSASSMYKYYGIRGLLKELIIQEAPVV